MKNEYPRPQFVRDLWLSLNGTWNFAFDDDQVGLKAEWYKKDDAFTKKINVPFVFQSTLSGIGDPSFHDIVWYQRELIIPKDWQGKQIILHFGAVDYVCKVFVNQRYVGTHMGGYTPFELNITQELTYEKEIITVYVEDDSTKQDQPRGKQYWEEKSKAIWYTRSTGIWQTVWLEPVETVHLESVLITPNVDEGLVTLEVEVSSDQLQDLVLESDISYQGQHILLSRNALTTKNGKFTFDIFQNDVLRATTHSNGWCWSPEHPNLFDVKLRLYQSSTLKDEVKMYFGMRKISTKEGQVYLNNQPYYQRLVLDQGYWPEGLYTAPTDDALKQDILLAKAMGFNGCRKHQKVEDPRFLYYADTLGYLVWGEMANAPAYSKAYVMQYVKEWSEIIQRDYNHPSIVCWVPMNESWGVPNIRFDLYQQAHTLSLYYHIKSLDQTRLVISNDGWEMTVTDICAVHNYNHGRIDEKVKQQQFKKDLQSISAILKSRPANRDLYVSGFQHQGEPILLTEFGGISYQLTQNDQGWGYTGVQKEEDFLSELERVFLTVQRSPVLSGYCYTQLTDVEQETNGLLNYDRIPKCDLKKIAEILHKNKY